MRKARDNATSMAPLREMYHNIGFTSVALTPVMLRAIPHRRHRSALDKSGIERVEFSDKAIKDPRAYYFPPTIHAV
jgi:hypothetical protein